ncbi:MAG: hypothetical protein V4750_09150 [Pseudomonadota bacterium]
MTLHSLRPLAAAAALALLPAAAMAQIVDFAQLDASSDASTLVLVRALPRSTTAAPAPLLSATATRWSSGEAVALGYVYRWALVDGAQQWVLGAGAGANTFRSRAEGDASHESALSARVQLEGSGPAPGGSYYALAQASSFRSAWFGVLQYMPSGLPLAVEWSRYHEATYQATGVGARIAIGVPHWFVRIGATRADGRTRAFVGVVYNGF